MKTSVVWFLVFAMAARLYAEPFGLVLSGGGAKGAYEVGVWNALRDMNLDQDVKAISGTSVGALNAALFAACPNRVESLWLENMQDVFTLNTNRIAQSLQKTLDDLGDAVEFDEQSGQDGRTVAISFVAKTLVRIGGDVAEATMSDTPREGYVDSTKLAGILDGFLPATWPNDAPSVYATACLKGQDSKTSWCLNGEPHDRQVLMLRASAAIPFGFDTVEIDGTNYVDGGWETHGGDNVPLEPILANHPDLRVVAIVYLEDEKHLKKGSRLETNREIARTAGIKLLEIIPSKDIGGLFNGWQGVFNASPQNARTLIDLGYEDAMKTFNGSESY